MKIPFLGTVVDERFLTYRLRSSSYAGMSGAVIVGGLFEYRVFVNHRISWDLLGVLGAMVIVKLSFMAWYLIRD
ncbi:MAG: hypothetical protein WCC21_14970 [Candidatus Acidiferrales bacterium]